MEQVKHERGIKRCFRFLPEWIICFCTFRRGVFDEIVNQLEYVCVLAYVAKWVVAVGFRWVDQVKNAQNITFLQKQISDGTEHFALWIGYNKAGICKHEIRLCQKARLAAARTADHDL